jgi:murein DD-endopeptidase MepM/ murein hydrolase activator NlpD
VNAPQPHFRVKIIPPRGSAVYRLHFTRRHLVVALVACAGAVLLAIGYHAYRLHAAESDVQALRALTVQQQQQLQAIARQTDALSSQLRTVQREDAEIKHIVGAPRDRHAAHASGAPLSFADGNNFGAVQARLHRLAAASASAAREQQFLRRLAMRVLNTRRMAMMARERLLAAIPSLNPVDGAIAAGYGWRSSPWPEFHKGVDLEADWGTLVHASAAGVVASAGWDGGFGIKVDIDHGNGYHTWYAHLSSVLVHPGETVAKGAPIARTGATGEATGPHLHYQLMHDGVAIDPAPYLNGVPASVMATLPDPSGV